MTDISDVLSGNGPESLVKALARLGIAAGVMPTPIFKSPDGNVIAAQKRAYVTEHVTTMSDLAAFVADQLISYSPEALQNAKVWVYGVDHDWGWVKYGVETSHGDALVVERIQSAPERKVFYIDVGDLPPEKAKARLEEIKEELHARREPEDKTPLPQVKAFLNESGATFTDISSEATRTYNFGQKGFVKVQNPVYLSVSGSGGHRIFSADGQSHYIPSGWIHLSWTVHEGQPNFVK